MFSLQQKREIADAVHRILRDTEHPELPKRGQPIRFSLHVDGAESWSWADIQNNEAVTTPGVNPWNERQAAGLLPPQCATCQGRGWVMKSEHHDLGNGLSSGGAWNEPCPDCAPCRSPKETP